MAVAAVSSLLAQPGADRRHLLAGRLRGDPVDGHRLPHHPRLRALRRRRGVRQGPGEHPRASPASSTQTYSEATNLAVNQTLMRSINTGLVALLPVGGLLFIGAGLLGAGTLKDLGLVLFVGMGIAVYSSIFFATPVLTRSRTTSRGSRRTPSGSWPGAPPVAVDPRRGSPAGRPRARSRSAARTGRRRPTTSGGARRRRPEGRRPPGGQAPSGAGAVARAAAAATGRAAAKRR